MCYNHFLSDVTIELMKHATFNKKVKISIGDSLYLVDPDAILFFSATSEGTIAFKKNRCTVNIPLSIEELEKKFNTFFRINRDCLINLEYLDNVSENENAFVMIDNQYQYPIDKDKKDLLLNALTKLV
jgi:DNA-binding LytR/AlgR family response regulator